MQEEQLIQEREKAVEQAGAERNGERDGKNTGNWIPLAEVSSFSASEGTSAPSVQPAVNGNGMSNGGLSWKNVCTAPGSKKISPDSLNPMLSSFDIFSSEEYLDGDKTALSVAFRKFLEEQSKNAKSALLNGTSAAGTEELRVNGKETPVKSNSDPKKHKEDGGEVSTSSSLKVAPALTGDGVDDGKMLKYPSKSLLNEWFNGAEVPESRAANTGQQLSEEGSGKRPSAACLGSGLDTRKENTSVNRNLEKAVAFSKIECFQISKDSSPERGSKAKRVARSSPVPPPVNSPRRSRETSAEEDFCVTPTKQEATVRLDFPAESLLSSSDVLAKERQLSQDLVQSSKKDKEFRAIFQHLQAAQVQRSSSELFAQHIVTIVHHIKAQHFTSSGLTLNERFTMYQRQAAEKESKPRKSPEIHRRLEVSPSAFKKHSQVFEAIKRAEEGIYKDIHETNKGDPLDLRGDIERRKNYSTHHSHDPEVPDAGDHGGSSEEKPAQMFSKCLKKSLKSQKTRSRSSSSSSSSSSEPQDDTSPVKTEQGLNRVKLDATETPCDRGRPYGAFQIQIRGRSWNRGSFRNNSANTTLATKNDDWDPEYTPKSKKYYLHDDRDADADGRWTDRGRGRLTSLRGRPRFIIRKANNNASYNCSTWAQANREQTAIEQDHSEGTERR